MTKPTQVPAVNPEVIDYQQIYKVFLEKAERSAAAELQVYETNLNDQ